MSDIEIACVCLNKLMSVCYGSGLSLPESTENHVDGTFRRISRAKVDDLAAKTREVGDFCATFRPEVKC